METSRQTAVSRSLRLRFGRSTLHWLSKHNYTRSFWSYFSAVFLFDAGYGVYFFLFNLYLLDLGFSEKLMGWVGGAMTLGSVVAMIPVGRLSRKVGLKPLIVACFVVSPLINAMRVVDVWWPAQIVLAALAGMAMTMGTVCYLPAVARMTTDQNRTAAFSLIISATLGTSALGGFICGYLPAWVRVIGLQMKAADLKRIMLLLSCLIVTTGLLPLVRLRIPEANNEVTNVNLSWSYAHRRPSSFLLRFLPLTALWAAVIASFSPFGNVYLASVLRVPMSHIGVIFSVVQIVQLLMTVASPLVFRALGTVNGIASMQGAAAVMLFALAIAHESSIAVVAYLIVSALQWMSSPGLYNLVMSNTPDKDRTTAAAATLLCNSIAAALATAGCGTLFARYGYPRVLLGIAVLALVAAILVRVLLAPEVTAPSSVPADCAHQEV